MIYTDESILSMINSPIREIRARVELYNGSTHLDTFKYDGALKSFTVERLGEESKFFGFGICQKLNVKLLDKDKQINITKDDYLEAVFGVESDYVYPYPNFHVTEINRDENTNELSITAYDALYKANEHTVIELNLAEPYTIKDFTSACAALLGIPLRIKNLTSAWDILYDSTIVNFEGTETIREALNAIAEATQTIYFINNNWELTFIELDGEGDSLATLDKSHYFTLSSETNRKLTTIMHTTSLGDDLKVTIAGDGVTQFVRDNPFWDLRGDIDVLLQAAIDRVGGLVINQFECNFRGNFLFELGDKIDIVAKDDSIITVYILNDTVTYNGAINETISWKYTDSKQTSKTPASVGDVLKQTYATVDKANKKIDLFTSEMDSDKAEIAALKLDTENINAYVKKIETDISGNVENLTDDISKLTREVEATMSAEDIKFEIKSEIENGVSKVTTSTGFTFDEEGLTIEKSGSEMKTQITEDGMQVFRDSTAVLTADNVGVNAVNLHATTYLIIGNNSRIEDWGSRTACFWIGGN